MSPRAQGDPAPPAPPEGIPRTPTELRRALTAVALGAGFGALVALFARREDDGDREGVRRSWLARSRT